MSRKKVSDPDGSMEKLIKKAVSLAVEPFDNDRAADLPSLRSVAEELGTTVIRARKLLITAGYFESPTASAVQRMMAEGKSVDKIGEQLKLKPAAVYGYLPYEVRAYNLPETTANADRHKRYRATRKLREAVEQCSSVNEKVSLLLWSCVVIFQNYPFTTSGRNGKGAVDFTYTVSRGGKGGRHYEGESISGFGNEIWVVIDGVKKEKSISRSSVDLAFQKYLEKDCSVTGPKQLGVFGASYLLPLFQRFV